MAGTPELQARIAQLHEQLRELAGSFSSVTRLYELSFQDTQLQLGASGLLVEAFASEEEINGIGQRDIILLSTSAHIELSSLIGQTATLHTSLSDGTRSRFTGLVQQAAKLGSLGGMARYRIRLVPWIWLLTQCSSNRVWQDKSVLDIVESVFARYRDHAAWHLSDEVAPFMQDARARSLCTQYRESDYAFVTRLLADEGLNWRIEEEDSAPRGHRIVLFADSTHADATPENISSQHALGGSGIRFHGGSSREEQDSIQALGAKRTLHAAMSTLLGTHDRAKQAVHASVPTKHQYGGQNAPVLESYDSSGSYTNAAQAQRYATLRMEAIEARNTLWQANSTVRSLRPGTRFSLSQGPLQQWGEPNPDYVVLRVSSIGINNLPRHTQEALAELFGPVPALLEECLQPEHDAYAEQRQTETNSINAYDTCKAQWDKDTQRLLQRHAREQLRHVIAQATRLGYANHFEAIRADIPWRPVHHALPTASGSQSAIVVGADGEAQANGANEIYCDRLGRVRIRYHWQGQHDDAYGSNDSNATCWVRVAQRSAGAGMGVQFLPRIGQEVLVQLIDGDIDWPIIIGALYNGQGEGGTIPTPGGTVNAQANVSVFEGAHDHAVSGQGNLAGGNSPLWHGASGDSAGQRNGGALSGIRSKEFGGNNYNQLAFDDTDRQGRIQLKSTQAATELNLGHLLHMADNYRGSFRGLGAELRTDGYGAIRAGSGILISSYQAEHSASKRDAAGDNVAGMALMTQASMLAKSFSDAAKTHQTVQFASHIGSYAANTSHIAQGGQKQAPIQAMHTAIKGMLSQDSLDAARSDAADKNTAPGDDKLPYSTDPLIAIAAKGGVGMVAAQELQWNNGETASIMCGQDMQFMTGNQFRIHTGQAIGLLAGAVQPGENGIGLQLIAAQDPIEIQAQSDTIHLQARDEIDIFSSHAHIDWAAAKSISLSTAGGANITIENGNITVQCPGKIMIQAGKKSFLAGEKLDYKLPVLPSGSITPEAQRKLKSTFAFDQLTGFASRSTKGEFVALLVPIFGFDIPATTYIKLYDGLRNGAIANAEVVLMSGGHYPAAFDNKSKKILVHRAAADRAIKDNSEAWELMAALLHEFGHYIDAVLRHDLAEKNADGSSTLAADAPEDEGAKFAYAIAAFDLENSTKTDFAHYSSPEFTGDLKINYAAARMAIRKSQGAEAQRKEKKNGSLEYFDAGRGKHAKENPHASFGHASIEDALIESSFPVFGKPEIRSQIYFGNWLRDFSQILDPKIVRKPGAPKDISRHFSRDALTKIVSILAEDEFVKKPQDKKLFAVTEKLLGVYRPTEHIDNPTNNDAKAIDPRTVDAGFEPLPSKEYLAVDSGTSMKRYIAASSKYMQQELQYAVTAGATTEGYRHFGAALHVLEDYFAHSNFVELSLRKLGHTKVLPWTSAVAGKHPYPVVTGMFDSEDVIASTAGLIADAVFKVKWEFQAGKPGERNKGDRLMLIILAEHSDDTYLETFQKFLWLRDEFSKLPGHAYLEWLMHYTIGMVGNVYNFVYSSLLHLIGNSVDDAQVLGNGDPNTNGSTNPSHSQLAKDHDNHPFHTLAAALAKEAVKKLGMAMAASWAGDTKQNPAQIAAAYLTHPFDETWQDAIVKNWAKTHPNEVKRGESSTEWEALRKAHEKEVRDGINTVGKRSQETWDYLNKNYDALFGEKNQVKK